MPHEPPASSPRHRTARDLGPQKDRKGSENRIGKPMRPCLPDTFKVRACPRKSPKPPRTLYRAGPVFAAFRGGSRDSGPQKDRKEALAVPLRAEWRIEQVARPAASSGARRQPRLIRPLAQARRSASLSARALSEDEPYDDRLRAFIASPGTGTSRRDWGHLYRSRRVGLAPCGRRIATQADGSARSALDNPI